jgi:folate-binding protein YgfZ
MTFMPEQTPLYDVAAEAGARFTEEAGWLMPTHFGYARQEYLRACQGAALFDVSHRGKVTVAGPEARSFLHNLCTNDILHLPPLTGCEAFFANAKAKVVAHAFIYRVQMPGQNEVLWLDVAPGRAEGLIAHLDHYLISEQVEFADCTRESAQFHLAGPQAPSILAGALNPGQAVPAGSGGVLVPGGAISQIRRHDPLGLQGFDVLCPSTHAKEVWQQLTRAGAQPAGLVAYDMLRVEAGTPVFGRDIDENNLVMEVGRTPQAICYTKGCYLGQEPVVRSRDLGHLNRSLLGLKLQSSGPVDRQAKVFRGSDEVGYVTSSVDSPQLGTAVALAYIRRGNQEPGTFLEVQSGGGRRSAVVATLPLVGHEPGSTD